MIFVAFSLQEENTSPRADESAKARALLASLHEHIWGEVCPTLEKDCYGKPFFVGSKKQLSISHSYGAVAVAISDSDCPIGVDIENTVSPKRAARVGARFPFVKERRFRELNEITLLFAKRKGDGFSFEKVCLAPVKDNCFTSVWTLTEAILKADGGGFASAKNLDKLEFITEASAFKIDNFYLSTAKITDKCK